MRFGKIMIGILTVLLLVLTCVVSTREEPAEPGQVSAPFWISVESSGSSEQIQSWADDEGNLYVFLPGYARMEQTFLIPDAEDICIDGSLVTERKSCEEYELNRAYTFSCNQGGESHSGMITFVQSGGVPSLYIDVQSGSMDYIHLEKGNEETGFMRLYSEDGEQLYAGELASVKGRGNTSWGADKKPYNLTLSQEADLLEMGAAQRWILLSEGYNAVNIRNKIVYDFAEQAGLEYTPDCEWVDLYLNGEYTGLYLLSERNEVHTERIAISQKGSFVVSQEYESRLKEQKYPYVVTESGQALRIRYADSGIAELQQCWQSVENAILAHDGIDPVSGRHWRDLIDLDSWARKFLIEEVFGNLDAGSLSQYFYRDGNDPEGKIYAGPVWDYDFAMGGESVWLKPYTDYYTMNRVYVNEDVFTPWITALYEREEFRDHVKELFEQEFLPLLQKLTEDGIDIYFDRIQLAARTDGVRWDLEWEEILRESDYIRSFLENRTEFLSDLWIHDTVYHTVTADPGRYGIYGYFAVKNGELLPTLPAAEELGGLGWYNADTGEPFDVSQPIYEDVRIYVKKAETKLPLIHYLPMVAMIGMLPMLSVFDRIQTKKNGRVRNDPAKTR